MVVRGQIVKSIAGHDAELFYVVVEVDGDYIFLADGRNRKLERPKKKNKKHIAKTNHFIELNDKMTDKQLRLLLRERIDSSVSEN